MSVTYQNLPQNSPQDPFAGLGRLHDEIESRIQLRQEILRNIKQGKTQKEEGVSRTESGEAAGEESLIEEGFRQAQLKESELFDDHALSLAILQRQLNLLNETVSLVNQKQEKIKEAENALANIEEKNVAIDQALGIDCLQQADVALLDLNIETLGKLLTKFKKIYPAVAAVEETSVQPAAREGMDALHSEPYSGASSRATIVDARLPTSDQPTASMGSGSSEPREKGLHDWYRELHKDHKWLNNLPKYSAYEWDELEKYKQSLVENSTGFDFPQREFLRKLSKEHPNSRLLSRYRWLGTAYRKESPRTTGYVDLQPPIHELIKLFNEKASTETLERQLDFINRQIKNALRDPTMPDVMKQLASIFLTPFINIWTELIHDSKQLQKTLSTLKERVDHINSERELTAYVKRLAKLIEDANDMAFHLYARDCKDILSALEKRHRNYLNNKRSAYIQGLLNKTKIKQTQGKQRFEQVWLSDQPISPF